MTARGFVPDVFEVFDSARPGVALGRSSPDPEPRGHGRRLIDAIRAFEEFPALAYSRDKLLRLLARGPVAAYEAVGVVESDPALTIALLRTANAARVPGSRPICTVPDAVDAVSPADLRELAERLPVFDFFGHGGTWSRAALHFRLHSVTALRASERLIRDGLATRPDEVRVAALLHDIGKLVLLHAYGRYATGSGGTPEARLRSERQSWGLDHAVVGGVLARRLGLPGRIATLIERHHAGAEGDQAVLRLADTLAHYSAGHPIDRKALVSLSQGAGLVGDALDDLLYELPTAAAGCRPQKPSPLTPRETTVVRLLSRGSQNKQIALELGLSASTVRSHTYNVYTKLGVADRMGAVLLAMKQGWLA